MTNAVESTLLLLLNVMMVLAEPLVVFYKGRCKIFISCYWKAWSNHLLLKLWWTLWLIWPRTLSEVSFCPAEGYLKRSLCLLHRAFTAMKKSRLQENAVLGILRSTLLSFGGWGIWLTGSSISLPKWHPSASRRWVKRTFWNWMLELVFHRSETPPVHLFLYLK